MAAETITFYSYKGGTGRSLVVSHVANYLSSFGKRVVAIDFDLEAPGLHFKLGLGHGSSPAAPQRGLLDLMFDSLKRSAPLPPSLQEYAPVVVEHAESRGWIRLLAAGNTESNDYWSRLAQINWHDTFYAPDALGIPFFLELVGRVETELDPDYILIDSRTGVTEIGGVATTILPDRLVCLFTNSLESLQGTRNVIRSVAVAPRLPSRPRIDILPILTRIPELDKETEAGLTESALAYLNEPAERPEATLRFEEIFVLHSEPSLQVREKLLTVWESDAEPPLLRDYLRLFSRLVPPEVVEPHIEVLIRSALGRIIDDPDGVQKDLETLAKVYPHPASVRALLKFYRLRQAAPQVLLKTASRLFRLTHDAREPFLQETVTMSVKAEKPDSNDSDVLVLVDAVWTETGELSLGFALLAAYGQKKRAREIFRALLDRPDLSPAQARALITRAKSDYLGDILERAANLGTRYAAAPNVLTAFLDLFFKWRSAAEAEQFIKRSGVDLSAVIRTDPTFLVNLASGLGDAATRDAAARKAIHYLAEKHDRAAIVSIGRIFLRMAELTKFEEMLRGDFPEEMVADILGHLKQ